MFADDNHQDAQEKITHSSKSAKAIGLKIKFNKTEVMYQSHSGSHDLGQTYR